jgi:hypothetical protein
VSCAQLKATMDAGRVEISEFLADTQDSVVLAGGVVALPTETLHIVLYADPKDFSLLDLSAPVELKGPILRPRIEVGQVDDIGLLEPGDAQDVDCEALRLATTVSD